MSLGYGVVYPSDGSRESLSCKQLASLVESSTVWQERANRLVLDCRTALSLGKALHTPYMAQDEDKDKQGAEEGEMEDPLGLQGCVMQAVAGLGGSDYHGMDWTHKARLLRALCEATAQTRSAQQTQTDGTSEEARADDSAVMCCDVMWL